MMRDGLIATLGPIRQIAWLTEDLDAATGRWRAFAGIGPWTVYRNVALEGRYRGRPARVTIDVALSYQDGMQIEIIRPHGRGPSPYHDESGRVRVGMHHVAWLVDDVAAAKETAAKGGLDLLFEAEAGGGAVRFDGEAYSPAQQVNAGLIAAPSPVILAEARRLFEAVRQPLLAGLAVEAGGSQP